MKKVIHPCDVPMWNGKKYPMFCEIEFTDGKLSITGVIGPTKGGNAVGGCGQIEWDFDHANPAHNDLRNNNPIKAYALRFAPAWNRSMWYKFLEYWHDWHLNDMHAECEHQQALGWTYDNHHGEMVPDTSVQVVDEFDTGDIPMKWNEYLGHECPICGYRIGSAWTTREVPQEVIDFLFSLPDTDRVPNWV